MARRTTEDVSRDGRIGSNPGLATPEKGQRFYEAAIPELAKTYTSFVGENE